MLRFAWFCARAPTQEGRNVTSSQVPALTLNSGVVLPAIGFGVFQSAHEGTAAAGRRRCAAR